MGYWDYRLAFFLVAWCSITLPVWVLATYIVAKVKG